MASLPYNSTHTPCLKSLGDAFTPFELHKNRSCSATQTHQGQNLRTEQPRRFTNPHTNLTHITAPSTIFKAVPSHTFQAVIDVC